MLFFSDPQITLALDCLDNVAPEHVSNAANDNAHHVALFTIGAVLVPGANANMSSYALCAHRAGSRLKKVSHHSLLVG
jgi:hypothetical protein